MAEDTTMDKNVFNQLKKNKFSIIYLIIILILGIYLRLDDYAAEGYSGDCTNTIAAAVFAYYPHDYFPGLVSTEPPLGNYIIGLGCITSGEDFSQVKNVKPLFFPDRSAYIGEAAKNSEKHCFAPIYIFSIIFLIGIVIFALSFFDTLNPALYFIAFFTFSPLIITAGRTIHVDIFLLTFLIFALLFLWKAYQSNKGTIKEKLYFAVSFSFFGLSGATKFTAGVYIIFAFLLLSEKYIYEILHLIKCIFKNIGLEGLGNKLKSNITINTKAFLINLGISLSSCLFFLMLFFNFKLKNLKDTFYYMTSLNYPGSGSISPSLSNLVRWFQVFLFNLNIFDFFLFLFSFFILFKLIFKKNKHKREKFTIYLLLLNIFVLLSFKVIARGVGKSVPFIFAFLILISLMFSNKEYSIFKLFKIKKKYFLMFLVIYSLLSFLTLYSAPFHRVYANPIMCPFFDEICEHFTHIGGYSIRPMTKYFESVLKEDETFLTTGIFNFYTRHNDDILWWIFYSDFKKQTGREPRLEDYLKYYQPEGRRVRYIFTDTSSKVEPSSLTGIGIDQAILKKDYEPNHIIKLYGRDANYIYDLDNLKKKIEA